MRARLPRLASVAVPSPSHHQPAAVVAAPTARDHYWPSPASRDRPIGSEHVQGPYAGSERAKEWPRTARRVTEVDQLVTTGGESGSTKAQHGQQRLGGASGSSGSREQPTRGSTGASGLPATLVPIFDQPASTRNAGSHSSKKPLSPTLNGQRNTLPTRTAAVTRRTTTSYLESLSLPTTETELYQFLRRTKSAYTSIPVEWLASFHSHGNLAHLVSSRTYRFLLRAAFGISDLRLVRALLAEIKVRGIRIDDATKRTVLRGYAAQGPRLRREDEAVRTALVEELGEAAGAAVTRSTRRRNFGESGKGLNDLDELWKGWTVRGRDSRLRDQLEGLLSSNGGTESDSTPAAATRYSKVGSSSPRAKANLRGAETASSPMRRIALSRPPTLIPPLAHTLPGPAITALVQALVSDRRKEDALEIAESWLAANRPVLDSPSSKKPPDPPPALRPRPVSTDQEVTEIGSPSLSLFLRRAAVYHATAVVLLNILLKPLFLQRAPLPVIRSFITSFVQANSAVRPAPPLIPDVVTLRTLVAGVLGTPTAWDRATSLVDWFGYQWGIPLADPCSVERRRFLPPPEVEAERLAVAPPSAGAGSVLNSLVADHQSTTSKKGADLLLVKPHAVVSPDIALLLLRHAADQYSRGLFAQSANRRRIWRQSIRAWWRAFEKDDAATDIWTGQKARIVVRRAVKAGLFKPKDLVRGNRSAADEVSSTAHRL